MVWLKFVACVVIILFSGIRLARYGDIIAEKTGLGRIWIGLILVAIITSIPEVVASVSAVTIVNLPDLAVGNVLGSCIFNLTLFALADMIYRPQSIWKQLSPGHTLSLWFGIILTGVVAGGILSQGRFPTLSLGWVSLPSIVILALYIVGVCWIVRSERWHQLETAPVVPPEYRGLSNQKVYLRFSLAAAAIVGAAIWLSLIGDEISTTYGLRSSFVGTLFVAVTTSLPELAVTVSAVRFGALDMAAANILGSNLFDIAIISFTDFVYRKEPIFSSMSTVHLATILANVAMNLTVMAGLRFRPKRKTFLILSWPSMALVVIYILSMMGIYSGFFAHV